MKIKSIRDLVFFYDLLVLLISCYISVHSSEVMDSVFPEAYMSFSGLLVSLIVFYMSSILYHRLYDLHSIAYPYRFISSVLNSTILTFVLFNFFAFFVLKYPASRRFLLVFFTVSPLLLLLRNSFVSFVGFLFRFNPCLRNRVLLVGSSKRADVIRNFLQYKPFPGLVVVGTITEEPFNGNVHDGWLCQSIEKFLGEYPVDEIFFFGPQEWVGEINKAMIFCSNRNIRFHVYATMFNLILGEANQVDFFGHPLFSFQNSNSPTFCLAVKRTMDVVIAGIMLVLLLPLMLLTALLIKITMPGPALFSQKRSGRHGKIFNLFKFRSMVVDAEEARSSLEAHNEAEGPVFKMKNDPRITRLGGLLRKFSIDELPQLWNVLKGDMSLVGPRPPLPAEVEKYEPWQRRRLEMRPGLTCIWQVSGRNKIAFDDWMKLDLYYVDNWSIWLDIKILLRTIPAVLTCEGAY